MMKESFFTPLFTYLNQGDEPERFLNRVQLKESIQDELIQLISANICMVNSQMQSENLPFNYGVNVEQVYDDIPNIHDFCTRLEETIKHYEPRLQEPKVKFLSFNIYYQSLSLEISGNIGCDNINNPTFFPLCINLS